MIRLEPLGDRAVRFAIWPEVGRPALLARLRALAGVEDAVVTEGHAMVVWRDAAMEVPADVLDGLDRAEVEPREHAIDVIYDGPDLDEVAAMIGRTRDEVIALHAASACAVSFVGFLPGFAYLRGLDPILAGVPRRDVPRARVEAGAVAVAGGFTGIYPFASPGGWRVIGRAPGWAPLEGDHARLAVGDRVRFVRIG